MLKFSLGFPNEYWEMGGLVIPMPNADDVVAIVMRTHDGGPGNGFAVYTNDKVMYCENELMAAAVINNVMDDYHAR